MIKIEQKEIAVEAGTKSIEIKALLENNQPGLKYEWFFRKDETSQDESILFGKNPTATTNRLVLNNLTVDDHGYYTCRVSNGVNTVISAKPCHVKVISQHSCKLIT